MSLSFEVKTSVPVNRLLVNVPVNYEEEDMPNDFPGRVSDEWYAVIELKTGKITTVDGSPIPDIDLYMKVCDEGTYKLMDGDKVVAQIKENYVPTFFPGDHFGDYLIFDIKNGAIENWPAQIDDDDLADAFQDEVEV